MDTDDDEHFAVERIDGGNACLTEPQMKPRRRRHRLRFSTDFTDERPREISAARWTLYEPFSDPEIMAARSIYDYDLLPESKRRASGFSVLNGSVLQQMTDEELQDRGALMDIVVFVSAVFVLGIASIIEQVAIKSTVATPDYITRMPFILAFIISLLISFAITFYQEGAHAILRTFAWFPVSGHFLTAFTSSVGDVLSFKAQAYIDGALWKVISQTKLLITVISAKILLNQKITATQWGSVIVIFWSMVAYASRGLQNVQFKSVGILSVTVANMILAVVFSVKAETHMRKCNDSFAIVLGQNRVANLGISLVLCALEITWNNQWHLFPCGNFTKEIWAMTGLEVLKTWFVVLVMMRLNSVFKNLALSLSIFVTYLGSCLVIPTSPPFSFTQFSMITAMALGIIAYSSARRDAERLFETESKALKTLSSSDELDGVDTDTDS